MGGSSIEQELGLWKTLSQVVARYTLRLRGGEGVARTRRQCEDFLAELAEAAYLEGAEAHQSARVTAPKPSPHRLPRASGFTRNRTWRSLRGGAEVRGH